MKKKVYVCAPLGGNVADNLEKAKRYTEFALKSDVAPVVPHFYALCLDYNNSEEREIGTSAGLSLLWYCDEMWIFGDEITAGMRDEIKFCENMKIRMRRVGNGEIKKVLGDEKYGTKKIQKSHTVRGSGIAYRGGM